MTDQTTETKHMPSEREIAPVFKFLLGEGALEGRWFGDLMQKADRRAIPYWWRHHLREALTAAVQAANAASPAVGEEELARIIERSVQYHLENPWREAASAILSRLPAAGASEVERLRRDCAELYQVLGTLDELVPEIDHDAMVKALDNADAAANGYSRPHDDLLPFVLRSLQSGASQSTERDRALIERAARICETNVAYYRGTEPAKLVSSESGSGEGRLLATAIRAMKGSDGGDH